VAAHVAEPVEDDGGIHLQRISQSQSTKVIYCCKGERPAWDRARCCRPDLINTRRNNEELRGSAIPDLLKVKGGGGVDGDAEWSRSLLISDSLSASQAAAHAESADDTSTRRD